MTPRELIRLTAQQFRNSGIPDPENDAALLLAHLTGRPVLELRLDTDTHPDPAVLSAYQVLAEKRMNRIPLQYLLGEAPFCSRLFKVDSRVLIPRPETELLCEWALDVIRDIPVPRVLDLCCGSGCIGLTVKADRPDACVTLSDLSEDALNVTAVNAVRLSLDVSVCRSDLLDGLSGSSFDLIVSNPPYIPSSVCDHLQPEVMKEPRLALDGGPDGCSLYRRIIEKAPSVLVPGGKLMLEIGFNEAECLSALLAQKGFRHIEIRKDYSGIERMILAVLP
ncbi:MAG: peptide chain release factor N(5)-glutamine methyltransferase [Clostridia bacterium]|nr:peptide chain release factor N(5)-glutamine methyltransferase [Clostridia bacterium]